MGISILKGDIAVRAGLVGASGIRFNALPKFINEPYNHAGLAISSTEIHHVESKGYETVSVATFYSGDNAAEGAVIRFIGPQEVLVRIRAADRAIAKEYPKIPGNPFSSADDLNTVNCNEFIHELFRAAIKELLVETFANDRNAFNDLRNAYVIDPPILSDEEVPEFGRGFGVLAPKNTVKVPFRMDLDIKKAADLALVATMKVRNLIDANYIRFTTYDLFGAGAVASAAEAIGKTQVDNPDVKVQFEGKIEMKDLYPDDYAKSWNPIKTQLWHDGLYTEAVLHAFTPNSFINSRFFQLDHKVTV